jgi:hypothetical protein
MFFGCIERAVLEHGPLAANALLDELRSHAQAHDNGGPAVLARIAAFHDPSAETDIAAELALLLDRLRLQAVEEELKLLFESGSAQSPDAQGRGRELLAMQAQLKGKLSRPAPP